MKVLDLFSGIGGFSLGLERAGMKTVAFCELDENCRKVLEKHWPLVPIIDDVKRLDIKTLDIYLGNDELWQDIDVICGGFPCQDISVAGQKKGFKDELGQKTRSGLWEEFARVIKEVKPRYAIIENVANLRNLGLNQVIKDLWKIGYACEWHIISARSVGACHLRERIWIIAYPNSSELWEQSRRWSWTQGQGSTQFGEFSENGRTQTANPDLPRLWKPFATEKEKSEWWAKATASIRDWWELNPEFVEWMQGYPTGWTQPKEN